MTKEEVDKIHFKFVAHLSMATEHCTTYAAKVGVHNIGMCVHVPWDDEQMCPRKRARRYAHYQVNGKVYKKKEDFYEAMSHLGVMKVETTEEQI